jgi:tetratricopeptide (TPR) repeat protein
LQDQANRRFEDAEDDYRRALERLEIEHDELRYELLVNRGTLRLEREQWDRAAVDLRAAIQLDGRQFLAYATLAQVYSDQGQPDEAIAYYSLAIERRPDWAPLYRDRAEVDLARKNPTPDQRARALRDLEQAIRCERPGERVLARDHTKRASLLLAFDHRESEALAACEAALAVDPDYDKAHRVRIPLLLKMNRYDALIRSCTALIDRKTAPPWVIEERGRARALLRDYPGAIEDYSQVLALQPTRASVLSRRGELYLLTDSPQLALRDFEAVIRLEPSNADAYVFRGTARARLGQARGGVDDAVKALQLGEPTSRRLYVMAKIYAGAAVAAGSQARKQGRVAVALVERYRDRAVSLVVQASRRLPADQRAKFWQEVVLSDPDLKLLRRRLSPFVPRAGPALSATASGAIPAQ